MMGLIGEVLLCGFAVIGIFAIPMIYGMHLEEKKKKEREELQDAAMRKYLNEHKER